MTEITQSDFCIKIDFDKHTGSPERLFFSMAELIKSCQEIDKLLIKSISTKIEPVILLEDIEKGSIVTYFKIILENIDDEGLKNLDWKKIIGQFLVKGKYYLINFMDKNVKISSKEEIEKLQVELLKLARDSDIKLLEIYSPVKETDIITAIESFHNALTPLSPKDKVYYKFPEEKKDEILENTIEFNKSFRFSPEDIKDLFVKESITNEATMILTIKKPEFLGEAKWEFHHNKRTLNIKMNDTDWLKQFKNREFALKPGDAIKATVQITENYDYSNEVTSVEYEITKVIDIMYIPLWKQINLFED